MNDERNNDSLTYVLVRNDESAIVRKSVKDTPSFILLCHELIHAYHHMNNIFNRNSGGFRFYTYDGKIYIEQILSGLFNDEFVSA